MDEQKNSYKIKIKINQAGPFDAEVGETSVVITFKPGEFEKALGSKPSGMISLTTATDPYNYI